MFALSDAVHQKPLIFREQHLGMQYFKQPPGGIENCHYEMEADRQQINKCRQIHSAVFDPSSVPCVLKALEDSSLLMLGLTATPNSSHARPDRAEQLIFHVIRFETEQKYF